MVTETPSSPCRSRVACPARRWCASITEARYCGDDGSRSPADVGVCDRRELADQRRGEKNETDRDLVEAAQLAAAGGEQEHDHRGDGQDEREDVLVAPRVSPTG